MDQNKVARTAKRMADARAVLVRDNPFFGHLALGLQLACAPCGTACTDGEHLIFDPDFAHQLRTDKEMEFVVLHEVLHCVLEHCTRGGTLDADLFNIACDIVVNSTILEMWGMDTFTVAGDEVMHLAPNGKEGCNYNAEEVYQMLLKKAKSNPPPSGKTSGAAPGGGKILDRHDVWKGIQDRPRLRDGWDRRIQEAAGNSAGTGNMTQRMRKLVEQLQQRSKVNWRQLLHDFIQHTCYDYTFLPPDRRFSGGDFYLPAFNIDEDQGTVNDIWVCVDTSGSITDQELMEAMFEIRDAMRQTGLTGSISFFDTEITPPEAFTDEAELRKIQPKGGGGTDFNVIFRYLKQNIHPDLPRAILVFTDGFVRSWPREADALGVPVLWLISKHGNSNAPWGVVAML